MSYLSQSMPPANVLTKALEELLRVEQTGLNLWFLKDMTSMVAFK